MADPTPAAPWGRFVEALPVDGGSLTVIARTGLSSTVSTSDPLAADLAALQLDLGDGPHWQAARTGEPVLVPDLEDPSARSRWPLFAAAADTTAVRGIFAIPVRLGLMLVGVADLYSRRPTSAWSERQLADAITIAAAAARPAVRLAMRSAAAHHPLSTGPATEQRREVHQATGVLIVRLGLPPEEALARLEAHAFTTGRPLLEVAREVIERRLDISTDLG